MNNPLSEHLDEIIHHCIHCGMCLPVCPTYNLTYQEQSSPRGRIRLMKSFHEGSLDLTNELVNEMYFCLDCQACQTACPAGVQYGALVEDTRRIIDEQKKDPLSLRIIKSLVLRGVLASKFRTKIVAHLLRMYRRTGLREAVERSNILSLVSEELNERHSMLPDPNENSFDETVPEVIYPMGTKRGRVAFLTGCIMNVTFSDVHRDAIEVLRANGFEIHIPKLQECCGSLHGHHGDIETGKVLAKKIIDVFEKIPMDFLVVNSAGCSAFIKEYATLFSDDEQYAEKARNLSQKTKEITEFLVEVGFRVPEPCEGSACPPSSWREPSQGLRVTYHDACHLVHTQKISQQPRQIIQSIPGVEFVELPESNWCCGSAGLYNVLQFDDSMKLLERKMNNVRTTNADIVTTANPGCHLQLQYGIKKFGSDMEVLHPVSLLKRAYGNIA